MAWAFTKPAGLSISAFLKAFSSTISTIEKNRSASTKTKTLEKPVTFYLFLAPKNAFVIAFV